MVLGAKHVESPYIELGQISTVLFFGYFVILVPAVIWVENLITSISVTSRS